MIFKWHVSSKRSKYYLAGVCTTIKHGYPSDSSKVSSQSKMLAFLTSHGFLFKD